MRFPIPLPNGANLKNFYALPCNPEIKVNVFSNVGGRTTPCDKGADRVFNLLLFKLVQHEMSSHT